MAKGEFIFFACILTESQEADSSAVFESMIFDPPLLGIILTTSFFPQLNDVNSLYRGRAPPELSV